MNLIINASWMMNGKKGYWSGTKGYWYNKKKDIHTINRLSEAKEKQIVEYDVNGCLKKIWKSGKEVGTKVFKDYKVVNGGGKTKIYDICNRKAIYRRKEYNSYWFRYEELFEIYNEIPKKLDIDKMISNYIRQRKENYTTPTKTKKYTILQYDINTNKLIKKYKNRYDASIELKIHKDTISAYCNGRKKHPLFVFKYGKKELS